MGHVELCATCGGRGYTEARGADDWVQRETCPACAGDGQAKADD